MRTGKNQERGVITVLVAGLLLCSLSIGTLVIELGRYAAAKTQLSAAADSAATSMIAAYDETLYERYGIMAIDQNSFTTTRCEDYLLFNSDLNSMYSSNNLSTLYSIKSTELTGLYNLTYPAVLKRQILSRAKFHVDPTAVALNTDTAEPFFADLLSKCEYVAGKMDVLLSTGNTTAADTRNQEEVQAVEALMMTFNNSIDHGSSSVITNEDYDMVLSDGTVFLLPSSTGTVQSPSMQADQEMISNTVLDAIDETGVDISSFGTVTAYTETDISLRCMEDMKALAAYLDASFAGTSCDDQFTGSYAPGRVIAQYVRDLAKSLPAAWNVLQTDVEQNMLLNAYITNYFSNKTRSADAYMAPYTGQSFSAQADNTTFYAACAEYILGGSASETENQEEAYRCLLAIRMIYNLYMLMAQGSYNAADPWSVSTCFAWAFYESCADVWLQSQYNIAVPFNKGQPLLPLNEPEKIIQAFEAHDFADAMYKLGWYDGTKFVLPGGTAYTYTDCVSLAMWFVPNSTKLQRVADLIQLEMRYRQQYVDGGQATFLMSEQNTYCRVGVTANLRAMLPIISLGSSGTIQGTAFQAIRYAGY